MKASNLRNQEIVGLVNSVLFSAPKNGFTYEELWGKLESMLPEDASNSTKFYAREVLKGTINRLLLENSLKKNKENSYFFNEK